MKILFYSDPHLGLSRTSHTTPKSAARLRQNIYDTTITIIAPHLVQPADMAICLGDLFDSYSNSEATLTQGVGVLTNTDYILAGNHDLRNQKDSVGSLQFLSELFPGKVVVNDWGSTEPTFLDIGRTRLVFVPHVRTQEDFEKALQEAVEVSRDSLRWNVLCLHCNIGREAMELQDTCLNLPLDRAKELLLSFHRIFTGHEHAPAEYLDGRLTVIGNPRPTGFADLSDKRVLLYNTEDSTIESIPTWKMEHNAWRGHISSLPEEGKWEFLDLEDNLQPGEAFRAVSKMFSAPDSPFCIRLNSPKATIQDGEGVSMDTVEKLPETISTALKADHPELVDLWEELLDAA